MALQCSRTFFVFQSQLSSEAYKRFSITLKYALWHKRSHKQVVFLLPNGRYCRHGNQPSSSVHSGYIASIRCCLFGIQSFPLPHVPPRTSLWSIICHVAIDHRFADFLDSIHRCALSARFSIHYVASWCYIRRIIALDTRHSDQKNLTILHGSNLDWALNGA